MRVLAVPVALVAGIAAAGCGPSLRRIHRAEVYFERCYAADLDAAVPIAERRACWQRWIAYYQVGQAPDRIDYVRERLLRLDPDRTAIIALATGGAESDPVPVMETTPAIAAEAGLVRAAISAGTSDGRSNGVAGARDGIGREGLTTRAGTGPPREPRRDGLEAVSEAPASARPLPVARERRRTRPPILPRSEVPHCAAGCQPRWDACTARCEQGDRAACLRACRLEFRCCARGCG
jgi:hypothetical protein